VPETGYEIRIKGRLSDTVTGAFEALLTQGAPRITRSG
jgi:hypothetical protein